MNTNTDKMNWNTVVVQKLYTLIMDMDVVDFGAFIGWFGIFNNNNWVFNKHLEHQFEFIVNFV